MHLEITGGMVLFFGLNFFVFLKLFITDFKVGTF